VRWIHALSISTKMIYRWAVNVCRNWSAKDLIRNSMGKLRLESPVFSFDHELPVARRLTGANPLPAIALLIHDDILKESNEPIFIGRHEAIIALVL
jgi:hypothetical protein